MAAEGVAMSAANVSWINERIKRNIESIAELEKQFERQRTPADRVSDAVSAFGGSARFVAANAAAISLWVGWNLLAPPGLRLDPGLGVLQLLVTVEALLLASLVLMSQNRQRRQAEHWAHVDLQLSLLTEQESTKTLQVLQGLCRCLGMEGAARDKELKQLAEEVPVAALVAEVGKARPAEEAGLAEVAAVLLQETLAEKKAEGEGEKPTPPKQDAAPPP
jgi:uncharacterized membrane protein